MIPPPLPEARDALSVARRMQDFPSSFSPMLVKELRQGMRTHLFTVAFILLQSVMVLSLLAGLADPSSLAADGFFWFFIGITLLIVQPLRGFNALSSEYLLNTMDLIQLTRLDSWRITVGKWMALNAQTLLFLTGVMPYLVMRYFLGNVDFITDLTGLLFLGLGSALASAITIGCSAFRHVILRGVLVIAFGIGFVLLYVTIQTTILRSGWGESRLATMGLAALSLLYGSFFFLSFGASRIAPLSENHSTRKRLVALGFTALALGFLWFDIEGAVLLVVGLILGLACVDALTEPLPVYSKVLEPFRRHPLGRLGATFLAPGWMGGISFFLICFGVFASFACFVNRTSSSSPFPTGDPIGFVTFLISWANLFLFPLILIHLFFPKRASGSFTFGLYTFIQGCALLLTIMTATLAEALDRFDHLIFALVPIPSILLVALENGGANDGYKLIHLATALLTLLIGIAVPLFRQRASVGEFIRHLKRR